MTSRRGKPGIALRRRERLACPVLLALALTCFLIVFSNASDGGLRFMAALNPAGDPASWLVVGLGGLGCLVAGAGQNAAGETLQAATRNQLASPFTLGITSAMTLAYLSLSFAPSAPWWAVAPLGFGMMLAVGALPQCLTLSGRKRGDGTAAVLYGLAVTVFLNAVVACLAFFSKPLDYNAYGWMTTSFVTVTPEKLAAGAGIVCLGLALLALTSKRLRAVSDGAFRGATLGGSPAGTRLAALLVATVLCLGAFVAYAPFTLVGFALPYLTKRYLTRNPDFRRSVFPSTLWTLCVLWLAYLVRVRLGLDTNAAAIVLTLPFVAFAGFGSGRRPWRLLAR